jgi:PleD family two-component response regulator
VRKEQIAHEQSNVAQLVTVSLGVGTIIPEAHDTPLAFIEAVDRLLYQAKQQGRDRLLHGHCGSGETGACQA